jgi:chromate transporter
MTTLAFADLLALFGHLVVLSLLTNGSVFAVVPDMRRTMVTDMSLLSDAQFNASIALGNAAPGPNVLFVAVIGYQAAGLIGAVVTLLGILLPSTTLAYAVSRWGGAQRETRAMRAFKAASAPIVIALPLATGWILATHAPGWSQLALTVAAALLVWLTRVHVLVPIAAGAAAGALGLLDFI